MLAAFVWFLLISPLQLHLYPFADPPASIPETKRFTLEEMDTLFGGSNHIEKGGDLLHVEDAHVSQFTLLSRFTLIVLTSVFLQQHAEIGHGQNSLNTNDLITSEGRVAYDSHIAETKE